jgi:hypothetical protein
VAPPQRRAPAAWASAAASPWAPPEPVGGSGVSPLRRLLFEVSRVGESGGQEEGLTVGCGTTGELEEGKICSEYSTTWYSENGKSMGRKGSRGGMTGLPSPV